ncbi:MAG: hypothetical protein D6743_06470 [Calditrichaeota bacterium]|nr:MAG: hypothetical protein D6743_06470 [Calditrichota bacterium]
MLKSRQTIFAMSLLTGALVAAGLFFSCAKDDPTLTRFEQALLVEIIAGPKTGATLLNNEFFTFEWRSVGGKGDVVYEIQLSGVDPEPITTTELSKTYPGQPEGTYTFTVTARAGSETSTDSRTFDVGPNLGPPEATIFGARGSASSGGSGVIPQYAPGQSAFVKWTAKDVDKFGSVTGFRWRITDNDPFNDFNLATVAGFEVPAAPGMYTFTLEARDNNGATSTTTFDYEVKEPTILILDDKAQSDVLDEIDEDKFYSEIFEGFAFATWDVAEMGTPTAADLAPYEVTVLYSGPSALWQTIGDAYPERPVFLSDYVDAGGKIWVMGQSILEDVAQSQGHANPPDPTEFEVIYLHLAPATGDSATDVTRQWSRAGAFSGDLQFSFADNVLGDPENFPRITIQAQVGDVDEIVAGDGAEIIYTGKGGLGDPIGDVALRFPAGGTNTQVVFQTFPLFENRNAKASLVDSRTLAQEIMREMGQ